MKVFESKHWAWWNLLIGVGFLLLAVVYVLRGATVAPVALRIGVALGFVALAWMQFRYGR